MAQTWLRASVHSKEMWSTLPRRAAELSIICAEVGCAPFCAGPLGHLSAPTPALSGSAALSASVTQKEAWYYGRSVVLNELEALVGQGGKSRKQRTFRTLSVPTAPSPIPLWRDQAKEPLTDYQSGIFWKALDPCISSLSLEEPVPRPQDLGSAVETLEEYARWCLAMYEGGQDPDDDAEEEEQAAQNREAAREMARQLTEAVIAMVSGTEPERIPDGSIEHYLNQARAAGVQVTHNDSQSHQRDHSTDPYTEEDLRYHATHNQHEQRACLRHSNQNVSGENNWSSTGTSRKWSDPKGQQSQQYNRRRKQESKKRIETKTNNEAETTESPTTRQPHGKGSKRTKALRY